MIVAKRHLPFDREGCASDVALAKTASAGLVDLSPRGRFGIKGPGAIEWLEGRGLRLPAVNRAAIQDDVRMLRLGTSEVVLLEHGESAVLRILDSWRSSTGRKGYDTWRHEGWVWLRIVGEEAGSVFARLCAIDVRAHVFTKDMVAQTRIGGIDAVVVRSPADTQGFDVLADASFAAFLAATISHEIESGASVESS